MNDIHHQRIEKDIDLNGQCMHYSECGNPDGWPVVLMHGWGCSHKTLESIERFLEPKFHVYNIDFPGFGESPEPTEVWGVREYTDMVERFLDSCGIANPILLGHSFGGRVGILLSTRRPVKKLILTDAAGMKPHRGWRYYAKVYSYKLWKRWIRLSHTKERADAILAEAQSRRGSADYRAASPHMRRVFVKVVNEYLEKCLPDIQAPTLLIWGENDTATPLRDAQKMEKEIPDAGLVCFPGCGHYSFLDNPTGYRAVVNEFLKPEAMSQE